MFKNILISFIQFYDFLLFSLTVCGVYFYVWDGTRRIKEKVGWRTGWKFPVVQVLLWIDHGGGCCSPWALWLIKWLLMGQTFICCFSGWSRKQTETKFLRPTSNKIMGQIYKEGELVYFHRKVTGRNLMLCPCLMMPSGLWDLRFSSSTWLPHWDDIFK